MTLEQQVTNLELSKKLKELRVKQESLFVWSSPSGSGEWTLHERLKINHPNYNSPYYSEISAFTVAGLGEMLPKDIFIKREFRINNFKDYKFELVCEKKGLYAWNVFYEYKGMIDLLKKSKNNKPKIVTYKHTVLDTEANARAKMLIYLLENKLI